MKTIKIDAYVSPQVPAEYAAHKLNLLSTLTELSSLSGGKIQVDVHEIENFSDEAANGRKGLRHRAARGVARSTAARARRKKSSSAPRSPPASTAS